MVISHKIETHEIVHRALKNKTFPTELIHDTTVMFAGGNNLLRLKFNHFEGKLLELTEWSSMFNATVDQRPLSDTEKMSVSEDTTLWQDNVNNFLNGLFGNSTLVLP